MSKFDTMQNKICKEDRISLQISLELQEHSAYKIFLFPRGWFYDKRTEQKLEFVDVRNGEHVSIQLSLQVEDPKYSTLTFFLFTANAKTPH